MSKQMDNMHTKSVLEPLGWLLQLITGILLVILVTFHFIETHMISHDALDFEKVVERLSSGGYKAFYALLLLTVSFHAYNGIRAIILDTEFGRENRKAVNIAMAIVIIGAFVYGLQLLIAF
ncbi:succinate dehydrogenase subunit D [Archaeoglobus sulfaticallidus PM70-1]|uniref:Succinate dehydrogenase subunit D n=1 Tax=Archaeoglobus sulfaticallidus PM70-1 TaxID=387631 RepID=N0BEV3_9EURY|nr:succinate dehydrogenase subunit D [Archaeoglobus sulfaticallidus]AGK62174.1 succinate dehydrogenase subunit D [Archaeoglobus sulfaticallidus PM70-1]